MAKRFLSVAASVAGIALSVIATFYDALYWRAYYKYQSGGTAYTKDQLNHEFINDMTFPLVATFAFAVAAFILYAAIAQININKFTKVAVSKVIGAIAFFVSIVLLFMYDIPGEGLELLLYGPVYFVIAGVQFVLFIVMLVRNKKDANGVLAIIFFTIGIICSASIAGNCKEWSVYVTTILIAASLVNTIVWYREDEVQKTNWLAIPVSVICIVLSGTIAFYGTVGYVDSKERITAKMRGVVYVGSNDGKEKERAYFTINGFEGYYAHKVGTNYYYPYRDGEYCVVEGYDFSSENIFVPATLNGKKIIFAPGGYSEPVKFFKFLAKNRDKFKSITFADELDYSVKDDIVYDKQNNLNIVFCLSNKKDIVITEQVVGEYAFAYSNVENVEFKSEELHVRAGAFEDCPIKEVVFPYRTSINGVESIFGSAPKLQKIMFGEGCWIHAELGDFDEDVRRKNEKENITFTVETDTPIDIYDFGTIIYNYPEVVLNINMRKEYYIEISTGWGVSSKMMDKIKDDGSTFIFTENHYDSNGKEYNTKIMINFTGGV